MGAKRLLVVDSFNLADAKTKTMAKILKDQMKLNKVLLVDAENTNLERSARNLAHVRALRVEGINVYDIVRHDWVVLSKTAVAAIEKRLGREG